MRILFIVLSLIFVNISFGDQPSRPIATIPFQLVEKLIFLQVQVNGSEPLWVILDSGASGCVIEKQTALKLGLKTAGADQVGGAGAGKTNVTFAKDIKFSLPGLDMKVDRVMVIDFAGISEKLGHKCDGLIGYEFFASYVVSIDYDSRVVRVYQPESFEYNGDGEILPTQVKKKHPYVRLKLSTPGVQPEETELLIDTGSADSIDSELIAKSNGHKYEAIGGIGLGEPFRITLGTYDTVQIGKLKLENVHGASGNSLIGGDFLQRFRVIFDYSRARTIFEPSRHFEDETLLNLSGLDVESTPEANAFRISNLLKGFAGEKAGFLPGDLIVAIDAQPASAFTWEQMIRLLHQDGQTYWLTIKRGNETKVLPLVIPGKVRKPLAFSSMTASTST